MSVNTVTNENFEQNVIKSEKPVLVDFWASWCSPCSMLSSVVDELASSRNDISVASINIDEEPELASRYHVLSVPTLLFFKDGEIQGKSVGYKSINELNQLADQYIK